MSHNELISYGKNGKVAIITLNRPDKLNAFNPDMVKSLHDIWCQFEQDDEARVAIITGEGKAFSAGLDINDQSPVAPVVPGIGVEVTKPIVSALNGHCIGLGLVIALMSDIRVASENVNFVYPEAKIGYTGGMGSLLAKYIPLGVAMEMLLVGEGISAKRAYEVGLVNRVVTKDKLMDEATKIAESIANNAPMVVKTLKKLALNTHIMETTGLCNRMISAISLSEDRQEGFNAFMEKRQPNFLNK